MIPGANDRIAGVPADQEQRSGTQNASGGSRARIARALLAAVMVILSAATAHSAGAGRNYFEIDGGYKTGDFGTPTKTDLTYVTAVLGHVTTDYDFSVTLPYLFLSSSTGGQTVTESGVGDVLLHAGMILVPEGKKGFSAYGSVGLKLPTASDSKGLGTGQTDYGAFVGLNQRVGQYKIILNGGYIIVGQPANVTYNDISLFDIGISRAFGSTQLYVYFEERRAAVPGAKNPEEVNLALFHVINSEYAVKGSTFLGLNNGGPDFGFNLGLVRWF